MSNMKICWDNIENIKLTKKGNFRDTVRNITYHLKICNNCGEDFLCNTIQQINCSHSCSQKGKNNTFYGKKHSNETKKKWEKSRKGKHHTKETKKKISESQKGSKSNNWKGGYGSKGIPTYDTYAPQLEWCEKVRRNKQDPNVLEVKCSKCNKWFIPEIYQARNRSQYLKGNYENEGRFYCSDKCKNTCSIFYKTVGGIIKQDAVKSGRLTWLKLEKEVQGQLRQMVLKRDNNKCQKCGSIEKLQCHHIFPIAIEPLLSADVDNCITLCYNCHKEVHTKDGCKYNQLYIKEC